MKLGGAKGDGLDLTDIIAKLDDVTNTVIVIGDDFETAEDVFQGILKGKADDDRGDTDAGEHGSNIDAEDLEDNEGSKNGDGVADNTLEHANKSFVLFAGEDFGIFPLFVVEETGGNVID